MLKFDPTADPLAADLFAATRRVLPPDVETSSIDTGSTYGYREGMRTEVRVAPRWAADLAEYHVHLRARKLAQGTIYQRMYHVRVMSQSFRNQSPWTLGTLDIERYFASNDHLSKTTLHSMLSSVRKFYAFGYRERYCNVNPALDIDAIKSLEGRPRPAADGKIRDALDNAIDPRAKLAITIGAFTGLRISEIARVHTRDLFYDGYGRAMLRIVGKGDRPREVPLVPALADIIRNTNPGWIFPSQKGTDRHLTGSTLGDICRPYLKPLELAPHMLRHRYASTHYKESRDIRAVQKLLGHSSLATTQVYTAVPDESLFAGAMAAGKLAV